MILLISHLYVITKRQYCKVIYNFSFTSNISTIFYDTLKIHALLRKQNHD